MKQPIYTPGTMIAGKYRIDKAIARGGCSIVYRGTHVGMDRQLALKIMSLVNGRVDPAWQARFQREAKLASQLRHPNTITVFDYGEADGVFYLTMEWVEGLSLRNLIKEDGALGAERVAKMTIQILKSLAEAHGQNILHRDMKPSNIMITKDLEGMEMVKVLDFGLAKAQLGDNPSDALKLTRDGDFIGTPRYASPEQLRGEKLTRASDIYGVGMVMWEMLTAQPAVPSVDYGACVQHHLGPDPWMLPRGAAPEEFALIVERALSKSPSGRYQNCEEMLRAIEHWLEDVTMPQLRPAPSPDEDAFQLNLGDQTFDDLEGLEPGFSPFDDLPPVELERPSTLRSRQSSGDLPRISPRRTGPHRSMADLELDKPRESRNIESSSHPALVRAPVQDVRTHPPMRRSMSQPPAPNTLRPVLIGALVLVLAGLLGVGIHHFQGKTAPVEERGAGDEVLDAIISGKDTDPFADPVAPAKKVEPPKSEGTLASVVLLNLKRRGWSHGSSIKTSNFSEVQQTSVRLRRRGLSVDASIYECEDVAFAKELQNTFDSNKVSVRLGALVILLAPVNKGSRAGVVSLSSTLSDVRKELGFSP